MAYPIVLFAREPIVFDRDRLIAGLASRLGNIEAPEPDSPTATQVFVLHDHVSAGSAGAIPAQLVLLPADEPPAPDNYVEALQQSWAFRNAAEAVESCRHFYMFADMMSATLPQAQRRRILAAGLLSVLEATRIDALHFVETQQFMDPERFAADLSTPQQQANPTLGFYNVRFFNVSNSPGDMVMDTLGLPTFGLTDLQVHFRGMAPSDVARVLHATANYLLERGNVIDTGHTIQGRTTEDRWACRQEESLLAPKRQVFNVDPGEPYAAGRRAA